MSTQLPLMPAAPEDRAFSVFEVVEGVKQVLDGFPEVWIEGEISNFKSYPSGHWYFSLKDRRAQLRCVMFREEARRVPVEPVDGLKVYARGRLNVRTEKGELQCIVGQLLATTEGGFHAIKLERARQALEKDGLLDPTRKRALPEFPACIGVVTSAEGAAWTDVVAVVSRRWPHCELVLIAARVQGEDAPRELVRALGRANRFDRLDVLIVGRGGGSKEDLWAFNDEKVARAVAASRVPTISAVGHEIDTTLTDLVADLRAPTPSAAAEKAVPDAREVRARLGTFRTHLTQAAGGRLEAAAGRLALVRSRMSASVARRTQRAGHTLRAAAMMMATSCEARFQRARAGAGQLGAALDALSPLRVLDRGFAVARDEDGHVLRRTPDFPAGKRFRLRLADGEVKARAEGGA